MNIDIETLDNKLIIKTTLVDYASEEKKTLDVVIEISADGVNVRPEHDKDRYIADGFQREVWTEFYLSQLQTYIWDGTQEDPVIQHVLLEKGA